MLDRTSVLWVNLPLVGAIYSPSNKFVTSVKITATGESKLNDSPAHVHEKGVLVKRKF